MSKKPKIEKVLVAQVKFYEELHVIRDAKGEVIFVGSEETAKRIRKLMQRDTRKKKRR